MPKRGLGRGLDSLIPDRSENSSSKKSGKASGKTAAKNAGKSSGKSTGKNAGKGTEKTTAKDGTKTATKAGTKTTAKSVTKPSTKAGTKAAGKTGIKAAGKTAVQEKPADKNLIKEKQLRQETAEAKNVKTEKEQEAAAVKNESEVQIEEYESHDADPVRTADAAASVRKSSEKPAEKAIGGEVVYMRLSKVEPNRSQPRKYFDDEAISELADSIRQFGIIQPLLVQEKDGYYEIIAGERRWRAAQKAGLKEVPVIIREFSNQEAVEVALVENIQREDLNPIEEAKAYERLVQEYGLSQEEVAGRVSRSRSAVTNSMRLLRLAEPVQKMVETSQISEGHARALLGLGTPDAQTNAAEQVVREHLSVRQTEKLVRDANKPEKPEKVTRAVQNNTMLQGLSENLKTVLGTKVSIRSSGKNRGRIEIEYYSEDELDRIYELLLGARE